MFLYTLNEQGESVHVKDAKSGVDYFCPYCGCRMRVRRSVNGKLYFYAVDGHLSRDCSDMEKEGGAARDPKLLNVSQFQNIVLRAKKEKGASRRGGGGSGGGSTKDILPPCNLRQLQIAGTLFLPPDTSIEGGVLSDLLLTYKSFLKFVAPHKSLGFRVLHLSLNSAFDRTIRFVGWWNHYGKKYRGFFDVQVDESIDFDKLVGRWFVSKTNKWGRQFYNQPKYKTALVAGVWNTVNRDKCGEECGYCKNARTCCVGMQTAVLADEKQIFVSDLLNNKR